MDHAALIASRLRGATPWPRGASTAAVLHTAAQHGVEALLDRALGLDVTSHGWPAAVTTRLRQRARSAAAAEPIERGELRWVLDRFADGGVRALVLKGAALAYTHYAQPWLRPREDADLLVEPDQEEATNRLMRALGYRSATGFDGDLVTQQRTYVRIDRYGFAHAVDVHFKIANPLVFADVLTVHELAGASVDVPALGPTARGLAPLHALLLACMHRVSHHYGSERLLWVYDIHLLVSALTPRARDDFGPLVEAKQLRSVCADGLRLARTRFGTRLDESWSRIVEHTARAREPTAEFVARGRTKVDVLVSDLRALDGCRPRLRLIRQHLFPPRAYLERAYSLPHPALLPLVYAHRIVSGVTKWFRRH